MKQAAKPGGVIDVFVADCDGRLCQLLAKAMSECGPEILIRGFATDPAELRLNCQEPRTGEESYLNDSLDRSVPLRKRPGFS